MRVLRVITGTLLVVVALPMLVTGGALWGAMRHRTPDGAFAARISPLATDGYAIVAGDLDGLLRREAAFTRGGQTTLRIAGTGRERLFVGIGPTPAVERYLQARPQARLTRVRLARGPLPVDLREVPGRAAARQPLVLPATLPIWLAVGSESDGRTVLTWSPSSMRGRDVTLVVMNATGTPQVSVGFTAALQPRWISPTTWALLILGAVLFVVGSAALVWRRNRDIVYVVEPAQLPHIAARLGVESKAAPWFARVGGSPPHASSMAPTGRRHTRPPRVERSPVDRAALEQAPTHGSLSRQWPPVVPDHATPPVTPVPPVDGGRGRRQKQPWPPPRRRPLSSPGGW
jgi:hypothetical protein